jgi:hypothetical protein
MKKPPACGLPEAAEDFNGQPPGTSRIGNDMDADIIGTADHAEERNKTTIGPIKINRKIR